jgi:hypothetical protein
MVVFVSVRLYSVVLVSEQRVASVGIAGVKKRLSLLLFLKRHLLSLIVVDLVGGSLLVLQVLGNQILQVGLGLRLHC